MKKILVFVLYTLIITISLSAQKYEPVTVKAGMKVVDCFPFNERYRYPEFVIGRIQLKNGIYSDTKLNYNFLNGEMEYIKNRDTLAIANTKDIRFVAIAQDTFYYEKGYYMELISGGPVKVALKQYIMLKETLKKDSYGTSSAGSATNSYGMLPSQGNFFKLIANEDMVFQRTLEYYLSDKSGGFVAFSKKNVRQLFPKHKASTKTYLKSNKVDFAKRDDLIRFADYLKTL